MSEPKASTVAELFAQPNTWTQGTFARDLEGQTINSASDKACRWCLMGGIFHVYGDGNKVLPKLERVSERLLHRSWNSSGGNIPISVVDGISHWNDDKARTQEQVHALCVELGI